MIEQIKKFLKGKAENVVPVISDAEHLKNTLQEMFALLDSLEINKEQKEELRAISRKILETKISLDREANMYRQNVADISDVDQVIKIINENKEAGFDAIKEALTRLLPTNEESNNTNSPE